MYVADILNAKGTEVIATSPTATVAVTAGLLNERRIGAVIVCDGENNVVGVVSERDIIRGIALNGALVLDMEVRELMTSKVVSCKTTDTIAEVMRVMTTQRFRHLPVMEDDTLKGMISIGDVVKYRLEESEAEAQVLRDYVVASR